MSFHDALKDVFKGALHDSEEAAWNNAWLPTGVVPVDRALGGGFGEGRIHEVFGSWSTAKSALLYRWLINVQLNLGGKPVLFESEGGFHPDWWRKQGGILDPKDDRSLLYYPDLRTCEDFFAGVVKVVEVVKKSKFKGPVAIGWDSIAATGTKHLHKEGAEGSRDMTKAFVMDQGTKLIVSMIQGTRIAVVGVNQTREKIGAKDWEETHTPGGRTWPYLSSIRVELKFDGGPAGSRIVSGESKIGRAIRGEVIKNKLAPPFRTFKFPTYTEAGHPHPTFEEAETAVGIDADEALLDWYLGNARATFGDPPEKYLEQIGGGKIKLNEKLVNGMKVKTFYKKNWLKVLETFPHLRNYDAAAEGE